jgi:hypothetical protein
MHGTGGLALVGGGRKRADSNVAYMDPTIWDPAPGHRCIPSPPPRRSVTGRRGRVWGGSFGRWTSGLFDDFRVFVSVGLDAPP